MKMNRIKTYINKHRHIFAVAAIILTASAILGWVGYDTLPQASMQSERVIVNDDYSAITAPITDGEGVRQKIRVKGGTKLYGVSLDFHIFSGRF